MAAVNIRRMQPNRALFSSLCLLCSATATPLCRAQTEQPAPPAASATTVEVTGARFRDQPGRTSLSGAELARVPGAGGDPMRAIQALPGVATVDDSSSEPAVRGSRPFDNVYFVDIGKFDTVTADPILGAVTFPIAG